VGTGSGAVALALKQERPDLDVLATDVSEDALAVARANAARLGLAVAFVRADLLDGVPGPFDAVLSNPPYVADGDALAPDVARHEPHRALFGGPDGLAVLRRLVPQAAAAAPYVAVEVGAGQAEAVEGLLRGAGLPGTSRLRDLAGIERVVTGRRAA
jgi:release factor glutamine methyltransferase